MKFYKSILLFVVILVSIYSISSCERDDICAKDTPTTPRLILKFIDNTTKTDIKKPVDLSIIANDSNISSPFLNGVSQDSIIIPLKTDASITNFTFTINANSDDINLKNSDVISFQYTPEKEYVSSACGFRVTYNGLSQTLTADPDNWIKDITIERVNVTDETTAHIFIYH